MKLKFAAALAATVMIVTAFAVIASAEEESEIKPLTSYEMWLMDRERDEMRANYGNPDMVSIDGKVVADDMTMPYPDLQPDGSPSLLGGEVVDPQAPAFISDWYVSLVNFHVPNNPGVGWGTTAHGGSGSGLIVGSSNEYWLGDINGDGISSWVVYYMDPDHQTNGVDDDGDGCVDEKMLGPYHPGYPSVMNPATCGNWIPDGVHYFETGAAPSIGGENGDVIVIDDHWVDMTLEVWHPGLPPWIGAVRWRQWSDFPQVLGGHVGYLGYEGDFGQNANPEMDSDMSDYYVGSIDVRGFTAGRPPVNMACAAGEKAGKGFMGELDDGRISMSMTFMESYDNKDWNGDGGIGDWITGVIAIDPVTGNCRMAAITAVDGYYPRSHGKTIMAGDQWEGYDGRDWNGDGDMSDDIQLWTNIEARTDISNLISLVGPVYTSFTFTAAVPAFGWATFMTGITYAWHGFAFDYGITVSTNSGSPHYGQTMYTLANDEDGNPQSPQPVYYVGQGGPGAIISGRCINQIWYEYYLRYYTSLRGIGGGYDWTGDGDNYDGLWTVFCPDETIGGVGEYIEEETSKYAAGLYRDPIPFIGYWYSIYYDGGSVFNGRTPVLVSCYEEDNYVYSIQDDADGDLRVGENPASAGGYFYYHLNYQVGLEKPDFEIIELGLADGGYAQPGGTVLMRLALLNTGGMDIKIDEDSGLTAVPDYKLQGMSAEDLIANDGILIPGEVGIFYFTVTISAGAGAGILGPANLQYDESIEIFVTYGGVAKSSKINVPLYLKMFGNHLSCYRHKQNALRTMRAFDMDDDQGMLDTVKWASHMPGLDPERELALTISWYENGCGLPGQNDVEGAHAYSSSLTGGFGMGMEYWGFAPGQEEGNEGNGNGGLTGNDRKDAYGW